MLSNHVIDFSIIVNPREMKGYVNAGIFIHVDKQYRNEVTKKIYEEIKNLLVLGPPYEDMNTRVLTYMCRICGKLKRSKEKRNP
jgi:hypothetical protein